MEWQHILDKQPDDGSIIIQLNAPYEKYGPGEHPHYPMGMRLYTHYSSHDDYLKWCDEHKAVYPNFCWIYAKDFPFPVVNRKVYVS